MFMEAMNLNLLENKLFADEGLAPYHFSISAAKITLIVAASVLTVCMVLRPEKKLHNLPGPFMGKVTSLYRVWMFGRGYGVRRVLELHRKYGEVVQTGPNHVIVANVEALSQIYGTSFPKVCSWVTIDDYAEFFNSRTSTMSSCCTTEGLPLTQ